jgi:hypothetical protein
MYDWGGVVTFFTNISEGKGDSLATYWDKNSAKIETAMQKTIDKLYALE